MIITGNAVLNGADNRHGTDADGQRGHDKGIDKFVVVCIAGFGTNPLAKLLDALFEIARFADQRADSKAHDDHNGTAAR